MESELKIRRFEIRDVDEVLALEKACPELAHWERKDYQDVAIGGMEGWVAVHEEIREASGLGSAEPPKRCQIKGRLAGFVVIRQISQEVEILNLAVAPHERKRGTGTRLLREAKEYAAKNGAVKMFLEVRVSNETALRLYKNHGFQVVGRRQGYYRSPQEDALTLATGIAEEAQEKATARLDRPIASAHR